MRDILKCLLGAVFVVLAITPQEALADRIISEVIPVLGSRSATYDTIVTVALYNPSPVSQTVDLRLVAKGNSRFSKTWGGGGGPSGTVKGSNHATLSGGNKTASLESSLTTIPSGTTRVLAVRYRQMDNSNNVGAASGLYCEVTVSGDDGWMSGHIALQVEKYNGVAYIGHSIPINSGRPF